MQITAQTDYPETRAEEVEINAAVLSRLVTEIGVQFAAFDKSELEGPLYPATEAIRTAIEILTEAKESLLAHAKERMESAFERLQSAAAGRPVKVNIASGLRAQPGWINIDLKNGDVKQCLQWGLPFASGTVDFIFFAHALEHFYFPYEATWILQEIRRVLSPSGVVRIVVPDIERLIKAYVQNESELFALRREMWLSEAECQTPLEQLLSYCGASAPPEAFHCHKWGYDFATLESLLHRAGLSRVRRCAYMQSDFEELRLDETSEAGGLYPELQMSLFVEARR